MKKVLIFASLIMVFSYPTYAAQRKPATIIAGAVVDLPAGDTLVMPGATIGDFTVDNNASNAVTGNAQYLFNPTLSSTMADAVFVVPKLGTFDTPTQFAAAFNTKFGDAGAARVPSGTGINFGNFECNVTTAQTVSDTGAGGNHCFGGTIDSSGSAINEGVSIVANVTGAGTYYGVDLSLNNSNPATNSVLYWANCIGSANCGTAFKIHRAGAGDFVVGLDLANHNIANASSVSSTLDLDTSSAPTLSGCGSGASASGGSRGGAITVGAGFSGSNCTVTFANPYPNAAYCTLTPLTSAGATVPQLSAMSRTGFSFNGATSGSYMFVCAGR